MDAIFKGLEDMGYKFEVEVGWKDKDRKKIILESIKKLKDSGDESKLLYAKNLYRYYSIFFNLGYLVNSHPILNEEEVKYRCEDLYHYLDNFIDSSKRIITGVISALGNDEPLDSFHKYLMFTHLYSAEDVKEIGHEEIYRREQKLKEESVSGSGSEEELV